VGEEEVAPPLAGRPTSAFWRKKCVLLTGHTGFIGGWTAAVLQFLGARVIGYAKAPQTTPSLFSLTGLERRVTSTIADLRDAGTLARVMRAERPDIVLHLAAQSLVSKGYAEPHETFEVNVMGTINLLEQVRAQGAGSVVVMTSDKVYLGSGADNRENDRLGAVDPYGGSKVCCEVVAEVYAHSFLDKVGIPLATVRAGNVIGGGDWADNRLIPDAIRAFAARRALALRFPTAIRPWQHVLDAVRGLLLVAEHTAAAPSGPRAWNVGPKPGETYAVGEIARLAAAAWGPDARIVHDTRPSFAETEKLVLDSSRIRSELRYAEPWPLAEIVSRTIDWYRAALRGDDAWTLTGAQIDDHFSETSRAAP
jgi:CDP-glucose 4,6-dehydratase